MPEQQLPAELESLAEVIPADASKAEIDSLAERFRVMSEEDRDTFFAVVEAGWCSGSVAELISLTDNLHRYDFQPEITAEFYGIMRLEGAQMDASDSVERLQRSRNLDDRFLAKHIELLESSVDAEAYALAVAEAEQGKFMSTGYIVDTGVSEASFVKIEPTLSNTSHLFLRSASKAEEEYLSAKIEGLSVDKRDVFFAVVEAVWHCGSVAELINLTENLDCFELHPNMTARQYGARLLEETKRSTSNIVELLAQSDNPDERDLATHIERLESCVSADAYGLAEAKAEQGMFVSQGYITEESEVREIYRGPQDIPARSLIAVRDVDLAVLLTEMHVVGGDSYQRDLAHSLQTLTDGSTDYTLLLNSEMLHIYPADMLYHRNYLGNEITLALKPSPEIRTYHLAVTTRDDDGRITGSLYEVDLAALQESLRRYSFDFTSIDAEFRDGSKRSISFSEWNAMERLQRAEIVRGVYHFPSENEARLREDIAAFRAVCEDCRKPIPAADFITQINAPYMAAAENPQTDMIRISLPAAKGMLLNGDAFVIRLLPEGPVLLSSLDAMPSRGGLWYQSYREFAINKTDLLGLAKWAKREADMLVTPQPERGDKTKSQRPER
jgi:hypothetical protein